MNVMEEMDLLVKNFTDKARLLVAKAEKRLIPGEGTIVRSKRTGRIAYSTGKLNGGNDLITKISTREYDNDIIVMDEYDVLVEAKWE